MPKKGEYWFTPVAVYPEIAFEGWEKRYESEDSGIGPIRDANDAFAGDGINWSIGLVVYDRKVRRKVKKGASDEDSP